MALKNKKLISQLLKGKKIKKGFLIAYYTTIEYQGVDNAAIKKNLLSDKQHRSLFIVPKRLIKSAVDRNKIKRRLKEAFRTNDNVLPSNVLVGFRYNCNIIHFYHSISDTVGNIIKLIDNTHINKNNTIIPHSAPK